MAWPKSLKHNVPKNVKMDAPANGYNPALCAALNLLKGKNKLCRAGLAYPPFLLFGGLVRQGGVLLVSLKVHTDRRLIFEIKSQIRSFVPDEPGVAWRKIYHYKCHRNPNSQIEKYLRKVKQWKTSNQRYRWVASALYEIEYRMCKVNNYKKLYEMREVLKAEVNKQQKIVLNVAWPFLENFN